MQACSVNARTSLTVLHAVLLASRLSDKARPPEGSYDPEAEHTNRQNVAEAQRLLGMTYSCMEETTRDTLEDWKSHGWL